MRGAFGVTGGGFLRRAIVIGCFAVLGACAERELILPGEREDVRSVLRSAGAGARTGWSRYARTGDRHPDLDPSRRSSRPTMPDMRPFPAAPRFSGAPISGSGDARRYRITAQPVSDGARIYAMDSRSTVTAVSTGGQRVWSRKPHHRPATRTDSASGGGLAVAGGRVFATTGFGTLVALDAASGAPVWTHDFSSIASGAPTVANGRVLCHHPQRYRLARSDAGTGRVLWTSSGHRHARRHRRRPVAGGGRGRSRGLRVFRRRSRRGVDAATGAPRWRGFIAGRRIGPVAAGIEDVTGDPVLSGAVVVAGTHTGRTAAFDRTTGAPLWSLDEGAMSPAVVTPSDIFQVTDRNALIRVDRNTGGLVWSQPLPL